MLSLGRTLVSAMPSSVSMRFLCEMHAILCRNIDEEASPLRETSLFHNNFRFEHSLIWLSTPSLQNRSTLPYTVLNTMFNLGSFSAPFTASAKLFDFFIEYHRWPRNFYWFLYEFGTIYRDFWTPAARCFDSGRRHTRHFRSDYIPRFFSSLWDTRATSTRRYVKKQREVGAFQPSYTIHPDATERRYDFDTCCDHPHACLS